MDRGGKSLLITYKHPKNYHSCTHNPEICTLVTSEHLTRSKIGNSVGKKTIL